MKTLLIHLGVLAILVNVVFVVDAYHNFPLPALFGMTLALVEIALVPAVIAWSCWEDYKTEKNYLKSVTPACKLKPAISFSSTVSKNNIEQVDLPD